MNDKMNKLGDGGIILIRNNSPFIDYLCKYFRIEFNNIGFYYNTKEGYKFIIIDIFPTTDIIIKEYHGSEIFSRCNIDKVLYKYILKSSDFINKIKSYKFNSRWNKVQLYLNLLDWKIPSFLIFNEFMLFLDTRLVRCDKLEEMLLDSDLFSQIQEFKSFNKIECKSNINSLVDLLSNKKIKQKLYENMDIQSPSKSGGDISLLNYLNSSQLLYDSMLKLYNGGELHSSKLLEVLNNMNTDYKSIKEELSHLNLIDQDSAKPLIGNHIFTSYNERSESSQRKLYTLFSDIYNEITNGKVAYIKYNEMVTNFNIIITDMDKNYRNLNLIDEEMSYHALLITNDTGVGGIPILLKNGSKIFIPIGEYDYGKYSIQELEEMLIILDVYSSGNSKIDEVRTLITHAIAKKS